MSHHHDHDHCCHKAHETQTLAWKLILAVVLNLVITLVEVIGGLMAGSLALMSDAVHNLSDTLSLLISYVAVKLTQRNETIKKTFGYRRAAILAALLNSTILLAISAVLMIEAGRRFFYPQAVQSGVMITVAVIGFVINQLAAMLLHRHSHGSLNIRSAYLHLLGDALSSLGVVAGGIIIWKFNIYWIDPLITLLIGVYILRGAWQIVMKAVHILMQNVPVHLDLTEVQKAIEALDEVKNVHHVHVWQITENDVHFEGHINMKKDLLISQSCEVQRAVESLLHDKFSITHCVLQIEFELCEDVPFIKRH